MDGMVNIQIDLTEIQCEDIDWIHLVQDRAQWRVVRDKEPSGAIKWLGIS
jgi:hypothetical protein